MVDIVVPPLGESVSEATVARWLKKVGDPIRMDEPLVELETDKITLEVNATSSGTLSEIMVAEGSNVGIGAKLGVIGAGAAAAASPSKPAETPTLQTTSPVTHDPAGPSVILSPAVKKIVAEHDLRPDQIAGSGKDGRLTKGDVLAALSQQTQTPLKAPAAQPAVPRALGEREERVKMTRLRKRVAERLKEAQNTAAILTTFNEIDMTNIMALRERYKDDFLKKHGVKLGFMSIFVKACIAALQEIPEVNAEIEGDEIIYKNHYDIGVAVGTEQGLVVPIVRDADRLSLSGIEQEIGRLALKARDGKLSIEDLTGGTFTISNGGVYGSLLSTPILNPPQSGILGMHKIQKRPVVIGDKLEIRPMMYVALSYDHRIIDGSEAVTFLVRVKENIEDPQRLLLSL